MKKKKPSSSSLSRNYSGSSSYYTPKPLINSILDGIDYLLKEIFDLSSGIIENNLTFLDPAAGMNAFPLGLLNYAEKTFNNPKKKIKNITVKAWVREVFMKKVFSFEKDESLLKDVKNLHRNIFSDYDQEINRYNFFIGDTLQDLTQVNKKKLNIIKKKNNVKNNIKNQKYKNQKYKNQELKSNLVNFKNVRDKIPFNSEDLLIIFGNPPYSISTHSKNRWIENLIEDYKKKINRPGKKRIVGLKGIQDEYVKFMRFVQWKLDDQNNAGIVAFVLNNYFLDGDIFRGMRYNLRTAYDFIYIINLHGDPKKSANYSKPTTSKTTTSKTTTSKPDENVFDIQTGICLFLGARLQKNRNNDKKHCKIYYCECFGSKQEKFKFISRNFSKIPFKKVPMCIDYEFIPVSEAFLKSEKKYNSFPYLPDIFQQNIIGAQSLHDSLVTHPDRLRLKEIIGNFYNGTYSKQEFEDKKNQKWVKTDGVVYHDARDWKISFGLQGSLEKAKKNIIQWQWRGFDRWWVAYDEHLITKGSSSFRVMQLLLPFQNNIAIGASRVSRKASGKSSVFITDRIAESHFIEGGSGIGDYLFPLKINKKTKKREKSNWDQPLKANFYNFKGRFIIDFKEKYQFNKNLGKEEFEMIFYYIYGILNTPKYQNQYQQFLKRDFPHIFFPNYLKQLVEMSKIGRQIADCHLLKNQLSNKTNKTNKASKASKINIMNVTNKASKINIKNVTNVTNKANKANKTNEANKTNIKNKKEVWKISSSKDHRILNPFYDKKTQRIYFNPVFWIENITDKIWNYQIGGRKQLKLWLNNRKFIEIGKKINKKYAFRRAINENELNYFFKICSSIKQSIELKEELNQIFMKICKT